MVIWPSACYITLQIKKMPIKTFSASPLPPLHTYRERETERILSDLKRRHLLKTKRIFKICIKNKLR